MGLTVSACLERVFHQWNGLAETTHGRVCHVILSIALLARSVGSAVGAGWEQIQREREDSFISPLLTFWEMGMWRVARLMYLTQWKLRAEPMKTFFQGGQEPAWFMASLLNGVQYLDRGGGIDNSSFNSPSPSTEQRSPAPDTPHSSLLSHCFIYSWLTCSRGSAPPFWGVEISSTTLYNFKWWQWL